MLWGVLPPLLRAAALPVDPTALVAHWRGAGERSYLGSMARFDIPEGVEMYGLPGGDSGADVGEDAGGGRGRKEGQRSGRGSRTSIRAG